MTRFALVALLLVAAQLFASQNKLDGAWRANIILNGQSCEMDLLMSSGLRYDETLRCGPLMTWQSGIYGFSRGLLERTVVDWAPKKRFVLDAGHRGHYEWNAIPPGGSYRVTFISLDAMRWKDIYFGGTVTFHRH